MIILKITRILEISRKLKKIHEIKKIWYSLQKLASLLWKMNLTEKQVSKLYILSLSIDEMQMLLICCAVITAWINTNILIELHWVWVLGLK